MSRYSNSLLVLISVLLVIFLISQLHKEEQRFPLPECAQEETKFVTEYTEMSCGPDCSVFMPRTHTEAACIKYVNAVPKEQP